MLTLLQCEAASLEVLVIEDVKNKMTQLGDAVYHYIEKVRLAAEQQRIAAASLEAERGAFERSPVRSHPLVRTKFAVPA